MENILKRVQKIKDTWFLKDSVLFSILCLQKIVITNDITNNISCGKGNIYINQEFADSKTDKELEEYMKLECIRILLKHPYERMLPNKKLAYIASNALINSAFNFTKINIGNGLTFPETYSYEDIYNFLKKNNKGDVGDDKKTNKKKDKKKGNALPKDDIIKSSEDADKNSSNWTEDEMISTGIDSLIEKMKDEISIGSFPNKIKSIIFAEKIKKIDYKAIIREFRKNIISSNKTLTRMKPNRRFGFLEMGSKPSYSSNVLFVGDTSGSMSDKEIGEYISLILGFFKYGFNELDYIQFDTHVYDETLQPVKKRLKNITAESRGGTDVDDIINYVEKRAKKKYGGIVICSDGGFIMDKEKWETAGLKNKYIFCINNKQCFDMLKSKNIKNVNFTFIENDDR